MPSRRFEQRPRHQGEQRRGGQRQRRHHHVEQEECDHHQNVVFALERLDGLPLLAEVLQGEELLQVESEEQRDQRRDHHQNDDSARFHCRPPCGRWLGG